MTTINELPDDPKYTINVVSQKTGLLTVTMRAWERRYQVLTPKRGENGYRLYSDRDIAILNYLKSQVESGVSISTAAANLKTEIKTGNWPQAQLQTIGSSSVLRIQLDPAEVARRLFEVLTAHDEVRAAEIFETARVSLDLLTLLEKVVSPTLVMVGEAWFEGRIRVATEHFASTFIRSKLMTIFQSLPVRSNNPKILVGGAPGELHEIGPLMVSTLLREQGFRVEFLGPDIPLDDLVDYAGEEQPRMIILSATMKDSVEDLAHFQDMINGLRHPPLFGFGGSAFVYSPNLIEKTPGIYLGRSLGQSIDTVKTVINSRKPHAKAA